MNRRPAAAVIPAPSGFSLVDGPTGGEDAGVRVAHAGIERTWWVRVSVNDYNVTDPHETDNQVWCLHSIGDLVK